MDLRQKMLEAAAFFEQPPPPTRKPPAVPLNQMLRDAVAEIDRLRAALSEVRELCDSPNLTYSTIVSRIARRIDEQR